MGEQYIFLSYELLTILFEKYTIFLTVKHAHVSRVGLDRPFSR